MINKKAQADVITGITLIFSVALVLFISIKVYQDFYAAVSGTVFTGEALAILEHENTIYAVTDYMILFLTVGVLIGLFTSAYFINSHPIFLGITILIGIFDVIVSVGVSNAYNTLSASLPGVSVLIPITTWVTARFPIITAIGIVMFGLGLYAKPANPGGSNGGDNSYGY